MSRKVLLILLAVILVTGCGCSHKTIRTEDSGKPGVREETTRANGGATEDKSPAEKKDLVIKSDNNVPDEEAKAMLDEVDRQLDEMVRILDQMEEVNRSELEYGGEQE